MTNNKRHVVVHALIYLLVCVPLAATAGNSPGHKTPSQPLKTALTATTSLSTTDKARTSLVNEGCDIVLLIDSSGSMKITDPKNYRKSAAKLFISLLGKNDRLGVISFGSAATLQVPLTRTTGQNRRVLFKAVDKITSKELSTNITDAVQKGYAELKSDPKRDRLLIMMSDGKLALGSREKDDAASAALTTLLPELAKASIKLYTVAFTEESDRALLENMAKETGGSFRFAKEDKDVHVMFASIFEKIKAPDTVPFEGESFSIDSEIREATVLVTKKPRTALALTDPSNKKNTAIKHAANIVWFESAVFDMITIQEPVAGKWGVKLSTQEGNKVYVLTNLGLKTSFDKNFAVKGERILIDAWLEKQGGTVTEKDILESTVFSAEITGPDKTILTHGLVSSAVSTVTQQAEGKYFAAFQVDVVGDYTLKILAQGKTFKTVKVFPFKAVEPPVAPPVTPQETRLPAPAPPPPVAEEEILWPSVLIRLGLVNLTVALLAVGGYFLGKMILRKRKKQ